MQLTPVIAIHMCAALGAVALGPIALWARRGRTQRPRLHRAAGYAWVTLMVVAALSALFIRDFRLPNIAGYTPIHLLIPVTLIGLIGAFWFLARRNIEGHRKVMQRLYFGACGVAGAFTLLPGRYLGNLVWGQWLGIISPDYVPPQGTPMMLQIATRTPVWVWGILAVIIAFGLLFTRPRQAGITRIVVLKLVLAALSIAGTVSAFGATPAVVGAWLVVTAIAAALVASRPVPAGVHYDASTRRFTLPGSRMPLLVMLGIFVTKYAVNVSVALQPELMQQPMFILGITSLYGAFSGVFAGQAVQLVRMALRPAAVPSFA